MVINITCPIDRIKELILKEFPNFYECGEVTQEAMVAEFVEPVDQETMLEYMKKTDKKLKMLDWGKAEEHLKECEAEYTEIGSTGSFALNYVIRPLRDRFNAGERTFELYDEIIRIDE